MPAKLPPGHVRDTQPPCTLIVQPRRRTPPHAPAPALTHQQHPAPRHNSSSTPPPLPTYTHPPLPKTPAPVPSASPNPPHGCRSPQVRVSMKAVGICGSDVHFLKHGRIGDFVVNAPMVIGHESAGVVAEVCVCVCAACSVWANRLCVLSVRSKGIVLSVVGPTGARVLSVVGPTGCVCCLYGPTGCVCCLYGRPCLSVKGGLHAVADA